VIAVASAASPWSRRPKRNLNTQHLKGTVGLKSRSQAPPGVYFIAPLFYSYKTDDVKDRDGVRLPFAADLTSQMYGGGINVVTKKKLFGTSGRLRPDHDAGQCDHDPGDLSHEVSRAFQSVRLPFKPIKIR